MSGGVMNGHEFYPGKASIWGRLLDKFERLYEDNSKIRLEDARLIMERAIARGAVKVAPKVERKAPQPPKEVHRPKAVCGRCKAPFVKLTKNKRYCSAQCAHASETDRRQRAQQERRALAMQRICKCVVCGGDYNFDPKRARRTTCSKACSVELYKRSLKGPR